MIHLEKCFVPPVVPSSGHLVFAHAGGVLLLSAMRGEKRSPAWWAPDGVSFVEAPMDFGSLALGDEPVVDRINDHHWTTQVTANGLAFFRTLPASFRPRSALGSSSVLWGIDPPSSGSSGSQI